MVYWGTKQPSQIILVCHDDVAVVFRPLELCAIMQAFSYSSVFSLTSPGSPDDLHAGVCIVMTTSF